MQGFGTTDLDIIRKRLNLIQEQSEEQILN
jgi:hypothetical protein